MTREEFLEALRKTPRDWNFLQDTKRIRRGYKHPYQCPASSVVGKDTADVSAVYDVGSKLYWEIANAADGLAKCDASLRKQLLEACGLTEQA